MSKVPYPYTSREQYEAALRRASGPELNTSKMVDEVTKPEVHTRAGVIIAPARLAHKNMKRAKKGETRADKAVAMLKKLEANKKKRSQEHEPSADGRLPVLMERRKNGAGAKTPTGRGQWEGRGEAFRGLKRENRNIIFSSTLLDVSLALRLGASDRPAWRIVQNAPRCH